MGRLATPALLPPLLRRIDNASYGGEDVSLAYLLKEETGAAVINCGSFYQHEPLKCRDAAEMQPRDSRDTPGRPGGVTGA